MKDYSDEIDRMRESIIDTANTLNAKTTKLSKYAEFIRSQDFVDTKYRCKYSN